MVGGIITILLALSISCISGYFSVVGLGDLFQASFWSVVIMGTSLEAGKIAAAKWLQTNWKNPRVGLFHKSYLLMAIIALMLITAIGIYGFLVRGHLSESAPLETIDIQIKQIESMIDQKKEEIVRLNNQISQMDAQINSYLKMDKTYQSVKIRSQQQQERNIVYKQIMDDNNGINTLSNQLVPLKINESAVHVKLGPVKYVAALFGWEPEVAVRMVILIIMFAFDPLAIILVLSGAISIEDHLRNKKQEEKIEEKEKTGSEQLVELLEKKPDLLNAIFEVVTEKVTEIQTPNETIPEIDQPIQEKKTISKHWLD